MTNSTFYHNNHYPFDLLNICYTQLNVLTTQVPRFHSSSEFTICHDFFSKTDITTQTCTYFLKRNGFFKSSRTTKKKNAKEEPWRQTKTRKETLRQLIKYKCAGIIQKKVLVRSEMQLFLRHPNNKTKNPNQLREKGFLP